MPILDQVLPLLAIYRTSPRHLINPRERQGGHGDGGGYGYGDGDSGAGGAGGSGDDVTALHCFFVLSQLSSFLAKGTHQERCHISFIFCSMFSALGWLTDE